MKKRLGFDLIILGAPASGKDTQARLLEHKFALKAVESGSYLRGLQRNKTALGTQVSKNLSKGLPAPVKIIKEFLTANVRLAPKDRNLMFVGNPRLKPEAEFLKNLLDKNKRDFYVVYISLPVSEIWKRSAHRHRGLDDSKYVQTRINWTRTQVSRTINYFKRINKLKVINGNQTKVAVNKDILKAINDYKKSGTTR